MAANTLTEYFKLEEKKPETIAESTKPQKPFLEGMWNSLVNFFKEVREHPVEKLLIPLGEILMIILITFIVIKIIDRVVDKFFDLGKMESNKAHTLRKLIKSVSHYLIYFIALMSILIQIGFDPRPILAGAGIIGLAVGFGAQNLVRDVISGFFMIFESQLEVGDYVQINGSINGTVEEVGLRITKVREFNQRLHYLPNGTITQVTNYNREKMRAIIPITVPFESDLDIVNQALEEICDKVYEDHKEDLVEKPEVMGVTRIDPNGIQFTITALCVPDNYWKLERQMRREAVMILHSHGIQIAYPRTVITDPDQMHKLQTANKSLQTMNK
ncbi:small conductance mechanosensitive channel [Seinonella peptonophila]|uniref:Small conductance mechanosensitive channel n=1 Tax=Seinonella peptonophila TaxID=112248 RepID=A0A1M4ZHV0_9BACL|nr:mechanosensitive ion channel family protein [Seinonella peptonophila]SHF17555.1 small conductance mechanosensitive channel [Seinonella peptonophila]